MVINGDATVEIFICQSNENTLQISCDGHESMLIKANQRLAIAKFEKQLSLLHPTNYHYYDTLRVKLGWGSP